jgi:MFS family permease
MRAVLTSFGAIVANRNLRFLELSYIGAIAADWAFTVGLGVYAYQQGGPIAVGVVGLARMLPAALATPLVAIVADRYQREHVLVAVAALAAVAMAAAAMSFYLGWGIVPMIVIAGLQGAASTIFRPTLTALLPSITTTPEQLISANGLSSTIEGLGTLFGPLIAGFVVASRNAGDVFILSAVLNTSAAILVAAIRVQGRVQQWVPDRMADLLGGFEILRREWRPRLVIALFGAQAFVRGALTVLIVVMSFQLLQSGGAWVGFLSAALGAGGVVGGVAGFTLAGRRLAAPFAFGLLLWGIPLLLLAVVPTPAAALALLTLVGVGNAIEDVAGFTLVQRLVNDSVLARVFGVLFGVVMAGVGVGSIVAPALVSLFGARGALAVTGALLPVLVALSWRKLRVIDQTAIGPVRELRLLEGIPLFSPLSVAAKEYLAANFVPQHAVRGTEVIREGAEGDRFYIISRGRVAVTREGRLLAVRGPGEYFGEIALLRGVRRTATVTAQDDVELYSLDRGTFLRAVSGHPLSAAAGEQVVRERLATVDLPARPGSN